MPDDDLTATGTPAGTAAAAPPARRRPAPAPVPRTRTAVADADDEGPVSVAERLRALEDRVSAEVGEPVALADVADLDEAGTDEVEVEGEGEVEAAEPRQQPQVPAQPVTGPDHTGDDIPEGTEDVTAEERSAPPAPAADQPARKAPTRKAAPRKARAKPRAQPAAATLPPAPVAPVPVAPVPIAPTTAPIEPTPVVVEDEPAAAVEEAPAPVPPAARTGAALRAAVALVVLLLAGAAGLGAAAVARDRPQTWQSTVPVRLVGPADALAAGTARYGDAVRDGGFRLGVAARAGLDARDLRGTDARAQADGGLLLVVGAAAPDLAERAAGAAADGFVTTVAVSERTAVPAGALMAVTAGSVSTAVQTAPTDRTVAAVGGAAALGVLLAAAVAALLVSARRRRLRA